MSKKNKVNTATKTMKDPELIDMFNKMIGTSEPDPYIVIPKYENILKNSNETICILESFINSPCIKSLNSFNKGINEISEFVNNSKIQLETFKNDEILTNDDLKSISNIPINFKHKLSKLGEYYGKLKDCSLVNELIMVARNLKNVLLLEKTQSKSSTHNLEDKDKLSPNFILNSDGDFLILFNFSSLDFKQLYYYCDSQDNTNNNYILFVLHLIYKKIINIVKDVTSPDINVDKFSELLTNNIDNIRKHIPRCDRAFDKIKQSVGLLKNNFPEYYKDFISSKNPGIIVENFVFDVAKSSVADITITRQFRDIITFYRTRMQNNINDPKINKIFQMVGANLDILEEKTTKEDGDTKINK